jgi:hypothetical protein
VYRSEQCALKRQEELRTVWNGVHVLPNGEVERPPRSADQAPRAHTVFARPRRDHTGRSRSPPTIVRGRLLISLLPEIQRLLIPSLLARVFKVRRKLCAVRAYVRHEAVNVGVALCLRDSSLIPA